MNKEVLRIVLWQLILCMGLALILFLVQGLRAGFSAIAGAMAYWIPTMVFVWRVFGQQHKSRRAKQFIYAFAVGEAIKLVLSGIFFVLIVRYLPVYPLSVLIGFIGAVVAFWIASMLLLAHDEEVGA